jgi:hypothetical protein
MPLWKDATLEATDCCLGIIPSSCSRQPPGNKPGFAVSTSCTSHWEVGGLPAAGWAAVLYHTKTYADLYLIQRPSPHIWVE